MSADLFVWFIGIPFAMPMRWTPEQYGQLSDGDMQPASTTAGSGTIRGSYDFSLREALRTRAMWLITFGNGLHSMAWATVMTHQFLYMQQNLDLSAVKSAFVFSMASLTATITRIPGGILGDRFPKRVVLSISVGFQTAGLLMLANARTITGLLVYATLFGISWGVRAPAQNSLQGEYFWHKSFGKIGGIMQALASPLGIIGPILAGTLADTQGTYHWAFLLLGITSVVSVILFFLAVAPKPLART